MNRDIKVQYFKPGLRNRIPEPELGILPGVGAQIKNQKEPQPELSSKFRTGAGSMAIWEVAPGPFRDTNGFAK